MHLTYHPEIDRSALDRPTLEIKITPAMLEAGMLEFSHFNEDYGPVDEAVERIIEAALLAGGFSRES